MAITSLTYAAPLRRLPRPLNLDYALLEAASAASDDGQVDDAIHKAVHPDPFQRYEEISEFIYDLHHPNTAFLNKTRPPLIERNPVAFWKGVSLTLAVLLVISLVSRTYGVG